MERVRERLRQMETPHWQTQACAHRHKDTQTHTQTQTHTHTQTQTHRHTLVFDCSNCFGACRVLFLTVTIVLALSAACIDRGTIAALAKLSMSITSIFFMIAVLLFPLGFIYLDDQCPVGNEQPQCGLRCGTSRHTHTQS